MTWLDKFFPTRESDEAEAMQTLQEIIAWSRHPYHEKFLAWLEEEANNKISMGDNTTMIRGIERANTFREILTKLRRETKRAELSAARILEERDA